MAKLEAELRMDIHVATFPGPGILPDHEIARLIEAGMIDNASLEPVSEVNGQRVISYGLSSYGYDVRCAPEFRIFHKYVHPDGYVVVDPKTYVVVDPKTFDDRLVIAESGDSCLVPPNSFLLTRTVEYFRIPRDVLVVCVGKSTYARCGLIVNVTPLEPEWEGHITIEISNTTSLPARIYANEGIAQLLFFRSASVCQTSYADKQGKYQGQTGITLPRL